MRLRAVPNFTCGLGLDVAKDRKPEEARLQVAVRADEDKCALVPVAACGFAVIVSPLLGLFNPPNAAAPSFNASHG